MCYFKNAKNSVEVLTNLISNHVFEISRPILLETHEKLNFILIIKFNWKLFNRKTIPSHMFGKMLTYSRYYYTNEQLKYHNYLKIFFLPKSTR